MRLIFLVIASEDSVHESDLQTQQVTWAHNLPAGTEVIWLRGHKKNQFEFDGATLFVPCLELYENILEKTILGIRYLVENVDFDIVVRTNVSTYFNIRKTLVELQKKRYRGIFFGGYIDKTKGKYRENSGVTEYISGTGIFLSRDAAKCLSSLDINDYKNIPDDVAISDFLDSTGIKKVRMIRNNLGSTHIFIPSYYIRTKSSAISTLASTRMKLIHDFFTLDSPKDRISAYARLCKLEISAFWGHPEPKYRYLQRNRIVLQSFLSTKGVRFWQLLSRR